MASNVTWNTLATYTWNQILAGTWDDPLPYPIVRARNQGAQVTDATSHVINLPAGVQAGDLLYVAFSIDTASTVTSSTSTGWAKLASDKQGTTTNQTGEVWWKRATGSDAFTITSSTAEQSTHISIALQNAADPVAVTANGASAASYTPPAITPAAGSSNYRAIISGHTDTSAGTTQTFGTAAGYSNSTTQQGSTTTTAATNTQEQNYTGVSTITPGAVTLSLAEQWVAITTAIQRLSTPGGTAPIVSGSVSLTATPTLTVSGTVYKPPGSFFNLTNWKITVPYDGPDGDVNADEIIQPALNSYVDTQYFYLDPSNQMVCNAPVNGDTTSGSTGVRTELREMDGAVESSWDKRTASRQLTVSGYFDPTNITGGSAPKKVMIIGQIHETGGTPGIYITIDYDASPARMRLFVDGPGVGNLLTSISPTDLLTYRIECTAGYVNLYACVGPVANLPALPIFSYPASGFVEPTGSFLKTGSYNKTDTATGSTGNSLAKITYLNLNQALPVTWPASVSLTATPSLTVNAVRTTPATVSLTATPTITVNAVRTIPATINLTVVPSITVSAGLQAFALLSLTVTPNLVINAVRIAPATVTLVVVPSLSLSSAQLSTPISTNLIVTPTITLDAVRIAPATISLTILPSLLIPGYLTEIASVSLSVTPTLTISGIRTTPATVSLIASPTLTISPQGATPATISLSVIPSLSINAVRITPATVSLTISPTISLTAFVITPATLSLIATPTISVAAFIAQPASLSLSITPTISLLMGGLSAAISLSISPSLSISGVRILPTTLALTISPSLSIDAIRISFASISLSITPTLSISIVRAQTLSVSLIVNPTLSVTVAAAGASVSLVITPTVSITLLYIGRATLTLTALPQLTVGALLTLPATVALLITPTLTVSFFGLTPASVTLSITPTLSLNAVRYLPATLTLSISSFLTVNGVRATFPAIDLVITPTAIFVSARFAVSFLYLWIVPTIFAKGLIEGAGPGWPIVFTVGVVKDGNEPVSSSETQQSPSFGQPVVRVGSPSTVTESDPFIAFKESNV